MQKDLARLVEQVFILRNARECGIFGKFGETGVAVGGKFHISRCLFYLYLLLIYKNLKEYIIINQRLFYYV